MKKSLLVFLGALFFTGQICLAKGPQAQISMIFGGDSPAECDQLQSKLTREFQSAANTIGVSADEFQIVATYHHSHIDHVVDRYCTATMASLDPAHLLLQSDEVFTGADHEADCEQRNQELSSQGNVPVLLVYPKYGLFRNKCKITAISIQ